MSEKNPPQPEQRIGGGLVLLSGDTRPFSTESFALYKAYSLADRVFCVEPGLVFDAITRLNILRLDDICQLQMLSVVEIGGNLSGLGWPHRFLHKRLPHSLRAGALHGLMARLCGLSEKEIAVGILAECLHDNFLCAGGDSWKDVNYQQTLFDEDDLFAEKIFRYYGRGWQSLCRKYGLNPENTAQEIENIVSGIGLRGQIHEIADTSSYMLGDLAEIKKACERQDNAKFQNIILASREEWDVWNRLKIEDGQLTASDYWVLENFLRLRMLLWTHLYQNPAVKFSELLLREVVYPHLTGRKRLSIAELPLQGDSWLHKLIEREMGLSVGALDRLDLLGAFPKRATAATWISAMDMEDQLYSQGAFTLVFSTRDFQSTKSKTDKYFVKGPDGKNLTFKEAYPVRAGFIEGIAYKSSPPGEQVNVCWVEKPTMSENMRLAWEEARAKWQKRK